MDLDVEHLNIWGIYLQSISSIVACDLSDFRKMSQKPRVEPIDSMKAPAKAPLVDPKEAIKGHQAGDGIRSMEVLIG